MGEKTIKSKFTLTDPKDKKKHVFEFCETKSSNAGGGPRGIDVWKEGTKGKAEYAIEPNPHDNRKYNKGQAKFYAELAEAVALDYLENTKFPKSLKVAWGGENYKLTE
jgi:hypothetical protein